jgi:DNA-binding beta-propeller fold protein YncE
VVKIAKDGTWVKTVGTYGSGPDQFNTLHGIACDADGNVYVADRGNNRVQVYDYDLNFKKTITGMGAPWSIQVTPKYFYSGDSTGKTYQYDRATYKELGWLQTGLGQGQTSCIIHSLSTVSDNVLIRGSCSEWNVERLTIHN